MNNSLEPDDPRVDQVFSDVLRGATSALIAPDLRGATLARQRRFTTATTVALAFPLLLVVLLAGLWVAHRPTPTCCPTQGAVPSPTEKVIPWIASAPSPSPPPTSHPIYEDLPG